MRFFKFFVIALIAFSLLVIATPAKSPPSANLISEFKPV